MSKFYLGATFSRYREARAAIDQIVALGHECVEDWTRAEDFGPDGEMLASSGDGYQMADHWPEAARREIDAIRTVAEHGGFCVFLGEQPGLGWPVEFGMAIAFGVDQIYVVAPFKTTVFMALPNVHEYESFGAWRDWFACALESI
jgi:hypothetical protein